MQNATRMQELGIPLLASQIRGKRVLSQQQTTPDHTNGDPDYNPELDDPNEGDLSDTNNAKVLIPQFVSCLSCYFSAN